MTPSRFHAAMLFVFGSLRRAALCLGMHETTLKRMSARPGQAPQPIPPELADRLDRAERALSEIFPRRD